jgi:hypothetical protein
MDADGANKIGDRLQFGIGFILDGGGETGVINNGDDQAPDEYSIYVIEPDGDEASVTLTLAELHQLHVQLTAFLLVQDGKL